MNPVKPVFFFFVLALFALFTAPSQAATVCSTGADYTDARTALEALSAGGEVLFCRGETFVISGVSTGIESNAGIEFSNKGDMQNAKVGAYGSGERPILSFSNADVGFLFTGGCYTCWDRGDPSSNSNMIFESLYIRGDMNAAGKATWDGDTRFGVWIRHNTENITIKDSIIEGWSVGVFIKKATDNRNITIEDSIIRENRSQGVLGGGYNLIIRDNEIYNNGCISGGECVFDHNLYLGCGDENDEYDNVTPCPILVEGNTLYGASKEGMTAENRTGQCGGVEIVFHDYTNEVTVRDNEISEPEGSVSKCYGIQFSPAKSMVELSKDLLITGNFISDVGRVSIEAVSADGITITDNQIFNTRGYAFRLMGIQVYSCDPAGSPKCNGEYEAQDVLVENNRFWMNPTQVNASKDIIDIWDNVLAPITVQNNSEYVGPLPSLLQLCQNLGSTQPSFDVDFDGVATMKDIALLMRLLALGGTTDDPGGPFLR